jgi:HlyD family secretion protein
MKSSALIRHRGVRATFKVLLPALLVAAIAYKVKFAPVPVAAYELKPTTLVAEVMGTGTLEARVKTTISPRIQDRLAEVLVDQNNPVKAGQLLARLDDGELKQQVEVSTAELSAARATAERVRVDEARAQAVEKLARLEHQRASDLLTTKVNSQGEFDKAVEQLHVAEADFRRTQAANVEAERHVVTAEKTLLYQKERLSYAQILSPYNGLVVRRDRDPGGVVVPGGSLLQIISTNEIWVSTWIDETASTGLSPGQSARVVFRSEPAKSFAGEVARLGRETDRETREFLVDVRVKELPQNWTVGQRAEVFIETGRRASALAVPQRFVQWRSGQPGMFVNDHGRARWREVTLGLRGRETIEIAKGAAAGDRVVTPRTAMQPELGDEQRITVP